LAGQVFEPRGPIVEFGSFLVDDQQGRGDLRTLFHGRRYIGCDLRQGPGVDRVEDLAQLSFDDESIPTVLCLDTLEHVFEARRAVAEMIRVLAPSGLMILAAPLDFRIHQYPDDYWRVTPACMARLIAPLAATIVGWQGVESFPHTVFAVGVKAPVPAGFSDQANDLVSRFQARLEAQAASMPWRKRLRDLLATLVRGKGQRRKVRERFLARFAVAAPAAALRAGQVNAPFDPAITTGGRLDLGE
jgi:SAM-dependent methyltransferase